MHAGAHLTSSRPKWKVHSYGVIRGETGGLRTLVSQSGTTTCLAKTLRTLQDLARVPRGRWLLATLAAVSPVKITGLLSGIAGW